jgi:hypothetical protein
LKNPTRSILSPDHSTQNHQYQHIEWEFVGMAQQRNQHRYDGRLDRVLRRFEHIVEGLENRNKRGKFAGSRKGSGLAEQLRLDRLSISFMLFGCHLSATRNALGRQGGRLSGTFEHLINFFYAGTDKKTFKLCWPKLDTAPEVGCTARPLSYRVRS